MGKKDWGTFEGETVFLGDPKDRPIEELHVTYPTLETKRVGNNDNKKREAKK